MFIAKDDEAKRSRIWRTVTIITSILIILIAAFFLMKMFMSNPLEGTWESEDSNLTLTIKGSNSMIVNVPEVLEESDVKLRMAYIIDKDEKTITIKEDETAITEAVKASDGQYTEDSLKTAITSITTTFDYSVDQDQLTLTEREYGEQMVFSKQ